MEENKLPEDKAIPYFVENITAFYSRLHAKWSSTSDEAIVETLTLKYADFLFQATLNSQLHDLEIAKFSQIENANMRSRRWAKTVENLKAS